MIKNCAGIAYLGEFSPLSCRHLFISLPRKIAGSDTVCTRVRHSSLANFLTGTLEQTVSVIMSFILAMVLYPDVQKRAQAELDAVIGTDRLPNFGDQSDLPYIDCIVSESLRWNPVANLGGFSIES